MKDGVDVYATKVVMERERACALVERVKLLEENTAALRRRLRDREQQLVVTLHELAVLRGEKDTCLFILQRSQRGSSK